MKCVYCKEQSAVTEIELLSGEKRYLCEDCKEIINQIRMPLKVLKLERLNNDCTKMAHKPPILQK